MTADPTGCVFCDRTCPDCLYPIAAGFEHVPTGHGTAANGQPLAIHTAKRVERPLCEILRLWRDHIPHTPAALLADALHRHTRCHDSALPYGQCVCPEGRDAGREALTALDLHGWSLVRRDRTEAAS